VAKVWDVMLEALSETGEGHDGVQVTDSTIIRTLRPGGNFVSKNFQGGDAGGVLARLREEFETVKYVKPASSRKDSAEVFLVALNKR
jgi:23S rRNA (uridine2552-2'-O)-methyltransferase